MILVLVKENGEEEMMPREKSGDILQGLGLSQMALDLMFAGGGCRVPQGEYFLREEKL